MKRKRGIGSTSDDRGVKRRKKQIVKKDNKEIIRFSILSVKYPKNYVTEYREIRRNTLNERADELRVIKERQSSGSWKVKGCLQDSQENDDESMSVGKNSVSKNIRKGKCQITAIVRLYNNQGIPRFDKTFTIKTARDLNIPFVEPYFIYKCEAEEEKNVRYIDFTVKKIKEIVLIDLDFREEMGKWSLNYMIQSEIGVSKFSTGHILSKVRSYNGGSGKKKKKGKKSMTVVTTDMLLKAFDELGMNLKNRLYMTLYFTYEKAINAISRYEGIIDFDIRKLCNRMNFITILEMKDVLEKTPYMLAIPTLRKRYFIKNFTLRTFKKIEEKYNKLRREGIDKKRKDEDDDLDDIMSDDDEEEDEYEYFPVEYYWAIHISVGLEKAYSNDKSLYMSYSKLFEQIHKKCRYLSRDNGYMDCVTRMMQSEYVDYPLSNDDTHKRLTNMRYFKKGLQLLIDHEYMFITGKPQKVDESSIGKEIYQLFTESEFGTLCDDEWKDKVREDVDALYSKIWDIRAEDSQFEDRLYKLDIWEIQKELANQIRFLKIRNAGKKSEIIVPKENVYNRVIPFDIYNELQKLAFTRGISSEPIEFCTGLPGAGKTEVIKGIIDAIMIQAVDDFDRELTEYKTKMRMVDSSTSLNDKPPFLKCPQIVSHGVNGITVNVMRKRLENTQCNMMDRIVVMTMDMLYAKIVHGAGIPGIEEVEMLIIDEIQNVDIKRLTRILPLFTNLKRLRLFGDFNQIEPICIGRVGWELNKALLDVGRGDLVTDLVENNRVKKNPNSMSIVKNFTMISEADPYTREYSLVDDDDGTEFVTLSDSKIVERILSIYKQAEDPRKIHMITPMRKTAKMLNGLLGDRIPEIVMKKFGWRSSKPVPFCRKFYNCLPNSSGRFILQAGHKIRICHNYTEKKINTDQGVLVSNEVYNGERGMVGTTEKLMITFNKGKAQDVIWKVTATMSDNSLKEIVVGPRHVDVMDIDEGYFTTVDAMLGGEDDIIILVLGESRKYNGTKSIITNLTWFDRRRLISAISRAKKKIYIMSPRLFIMKDELLKLLRKREYLNGRRFDNEEFLTRNSYSLGAKELLMLMADLMPAKRDSDMNVYFSNSMNITSSVENVDFMLIA